MADRRPKTSGKRKSKAKPLNRKVQGTTDKKSKIGKNGKNNGKNGKPKLVGGPDEGVLDAPKLAKKRAKTYLIVQNRLYKFCEAVLENEVDNCRVVGNFAGLARTLQHHAGFKNKDGNFGTVNFCFDLVLHGKPTELFIFREVVEGDGGVLQMFYIVDLIKGVAMQTILDKASKGTKTSQNNLADFWLGARVSLKTESTAGKLYGDQITDSVWQNVLADTNLLVNCKNLDKKTPWVKSMSIKELQRVLLEGLLRESKEGTTPKLSLVPDLKPKKDRVPRSKKKAEGKSGITEDKPKPKKTKTNSEKVAKLPQALGNYEGPPHPGSAVHATGLSITNKSYLREYRVDSCY